MDNHTHIDATTYGLLPLDVEGAGLLAELVLDMRWSWNHAADDLWRELEPDLWDLTHNPWVVLQTVSRERLRQALKKPDFSEKMNQLLEARRRASASTAWFQQNHAGSGLNCVAYFSMEFMLSEALPIYSGGLGNVAGDQLKAASDLGVPVVGVGLLYQQGYFRQVIGEDGRQQEFFPYNDPVQLPVTPLRDAGGEWLRLEMALPGYSLWLRCWQVQVGRTRLLLLDANDAANYPPHRGITSELYGGGHELRLQQELVLGIGGWRLLRDLGLRPEVCHLNEGHAAFAVLERARTFMEETRQPFDVALAATRAGNLFTTHTAVPAGFDLFQPALIEHYLGRYARDRLGISTDDLLALGRQNPRDSSEPFNMAYLAIRGSGAVNGVSRLHGQVSRRLFARLFPGWPLEEVPVGHVTNGVHTPSWDSAQADDLWTESCGKDRWLGTMETMEEDFRQVPDARLWRLRSDARRSLVEYARQRLSRQLAASGASDEAVEAVKNLFDPEVLTIGFARRFAAYKRPNLLLHDPERLLRLLANPQRPVQLILAGKAHPEDQQGQAMIQQWVRFIRRPEARQHVIFLSDYDMLLTERLVQGVDVWINTPRRPWEACGTSGMKVLVNGGINLSELDGWWAEAYTPEVGWALGDGKEHGDDPAWDAAEADALYRLLEEQVAPEFYSRQDGIPKAWVNRMRESMARLTARFSANRTVREYTQRYYLPAAEACRGRMAGKGAAGRRLVEDRKVLGERWSGARFGEQHVTSKDGRYAFDVRVCLNGLDPKNVLLELYAEGAGGRQPVRVKMEAVPRQEGSDGAIAYRGSVPADRPAGDYTARLVPHLAGAAVPLEDGHILWQK